MKKPKAPPLIARPNLVKEGRKKPAVNPTTTPKAITVQNLVTWFDSVPVQILNKKKHVPRKPAPNPIYKS